VSLYAPICVTYGNHYVCLGKVRVETLWPRTCTGVAMTQSARLQSDPLRISSLITAFYGSAAVLAAAELGVFEKLSHLRTGSAAMIAQTLRLDVRRATLLLDACVALGLLEKNYDLYRNSLDAETYLVPGRPLDLSGLIRSSRDVYPLCTGLAESVRTGAVKRVMAGPNGDPEQLTTELLSQHIRTLAIGRPIIRRLGLEGRKKLLEVSGGTGTYSVLISLEYPDLHCTVLDHPEVVKVAAGLIAQEGVSLNVSMLPGDFRTTPFPQGNDVVLMFGFLHREPADQVPILIRRAAACLNPGGVLYVMDVMTDESRTMPASSALFALSLALTNREGHVFSHVDLQRWMEQAGLRDFSVEMLPPPVPHWLARGRKRVNGP